MNITILIPHWKTGNMTAYCISQILKYSGDHKVDIIVINNSPGDEGVEYLLPFKDDCRWLDYPKDKLQSHGIAFDWAMNCVYTDYFIAMESDSFPTKEGWLDYYEKLINEGVDMAGSMLELSGGTYVHPCGALYKKSNWEEAQEYCDQIPYAYFPNMAMKEGFACHLMIHDSVFTEVLNDPDDFIELSASYQGLDRTQMIRKMTDYVPCTNPFHNGMGSNEESVKTYGWRTILTEPRRLLVDGKKKLIKRIGFEPGQWFSYWHFARNKNVVFVPTKVEWIEKAVQQEYTLMENGLKHLWGVSSHLGADNPIAHKKRDTVNELYNSLPEHQRI